jgi:membrane protease YdiL (CAAX protease family)
MASPMLNVPASTHGYPVPSSAIVPFLLITFAVTWGILGLYLAAPATAASILGPLSGGHPLYFVATWSPGLAGFVVVLVYTGRAGLVSFLRRILLWRTGLYWWLWILLGIPLVYMAGSLLKGGPLLAPLPDGGLLAVAVLAGMMLFLGPVEEFGWRGLMQPVLQRYVAPFWAGTIIGITWGLWHLPAFFLAGVVFEEWSFLPFFLGNVTLAILITPIFNDSRGSLLLPMLFHWQLINPLWPDAQPLDTVILAAFAGLVSVWRWRAMFTRKDAITQVVPQSTKMRSGEKH